MPWNLTTPVPTGALDVADYDQVRVIDFRHDSVRKFLAFNLEYGRTVNGKWIPGSLPVGKQHSFYISDANYTNLIATSVPDVQVSDPLDAIRYAKVGSVWVERTYYAVKRGVYEWMKNNNHIAAGSVE